MDICVANSKRQCNDCIRKTELSPKVLYGRHTGNKTGLEALMIALRSLLWFENTIRNSEIRIIPASKELSKVYSRLLKYRYNSKIIKYKNGHEKTVFYKLK